MCGVSMLVGAPRNCSRFVCRYGFHEDVLDSVYAYFCTAVLGYSTLPWRYFYQTRPNGCIETKFRHNECTQHVVSLHGGHVVPSALPSSTATVKAIVVWNSWSRRYPPQMRENLLPIRISSEDRRLLHQKTLVQTTRFAVLWGVHLD